MPDTPYPLWDKQSSRSDFLIPPSAKTGMLASKARCPKLSQPNVFASNVEANTGDTKIKSKLCLLAMCISEILWHDAEWVSLLFSFINFVFSKYFNWLDL